MSLNSAALISPIEDKPSIYVGTRVTKYEKQMMDELAKAYNMNYSQLLRRMIRLCWMHKDEH